MEEGGNNKRGTTILITNDDGIDAPGLRALVSSLVNTNLLNIFVCAPDSEKSAVGHSITWLHPIAAKQVHIHGTVSSFAVSGTPADCTSLGISKSLFPTIPDLVRHSSLFHYHEISSSVLMCLVFIQQVVSGINRGSNCGYHMYVPPIYIAYNLSRCLCY